MDRTQRAFCTNPNRQENLERILSYWTSDNISALISAIQEDAEEGKRQLDLPEHLQLKDDKFFHLPEGKTVNH